MWFITLKNYPFLQINCYYSFSFKIKAISWNIKLIWFPLGQTHSLYFMKERERERGKQNIIKTKYV